MRTETKQDYHTQMKCVQGHSSIQVRKKTYTSEGSRILFTAGYYMSICGNDTFVPTWNRDIYNIFMVKRTCYITNKPLLSM